MTKLDVTQIKCGFCGNMMHQCVCEPITNIEKAAPLNPPKPHCNECDGSHEPSGARSDCLKFWKARAIVAVDLVEWARALLCSATPNSKFLDEEQQVCYAKNFGKWLAESNSLPVIIADWGCAKQIYDWIVAGTYRHVMQRHNGVFRAADESCNRYCEADTLPLLCDALLDWPETGQEPEGWIVNPEWVKLGETRHFLSK